MTDPNVPDPATHGLPILEEIGSELHRLFGHEEQASRPDRQVLRGPRRRSSLRVASAISLGLLATAAAAVAATGLLSGAPVKPQEHLTATTGWGIPIPSSVRLLALSAPDPAGGPPWGLRLIHTSRGLGCLQFGRLNGGQLSVIGQDDAFHDDGLLHRLPTNVFEPAGCTSLDAHGHTYIAAGRVAVPASGYTPACNGPEGDNGAQPARVDPCPAADERALYFGTLGSQSKSITYTLDGQTIRVPTIGPDGAYLIVTRAQANADPNIVGPGSPNGSSILPQGGLEQPIRSIEYQHGYLCQIGATGASDTRGNPCSPPGYLPPPLNTTEANVRAPISVRLLRNQRSPGSAQAEDEVQISFTARVGISRSGKYYHASLTNPCTHATAGVQPPNDIPAGARLTLRFGVPPFESGRHACPGNYHGSVRLVAEPYYLDEPPSLRNPASSLPVGTFSIRIP